MVTDQITYNSELDKLKKEISFINNLTTRNQLINRFIEMNGNEDMEMYSPNKINNKEEYILCSALWYKKEGQWPHQPKNIDQGFVVCGRRHHNCFQTLNIIDPKFDRSLIVQGFLTSTDRFIDRKEAFELAKKNGQIKEVEEFENVVGNQLFSEDLY